MARTTKKSSNVDPISAPKKQLNQAKREAEEVLEKKVSVKKLKKNVGAEEAIEKKKKVQKKVVKKEETTSSEDYSSDEEPKIKVPAKKALTKAKQAPKESTSEDDSSSDDEAPAPAKKQLVPATKNGTAKTGKDSSSSDESSEESEDEAKKSKPVAPLTKKKEESDSDESSDSDEDLGSAKKAPAAAAKNGAIAARKKKDDTESDDSSSEDDDVPKAKQPAKNGPVATKKKDDSSSSDVDTSSSDDDTAKKVANKKKEESSDDSDSESDSDVPAPVKKKSSSEEESEEEDEEPSKTPKKNGTDVEMVDAEPTKGLSSDKKAPKTPATPQSQSSGSKTLFVGNLSFSVEQADVENFFKSCGEVVDVRFATRPDGEFRGFGHVEFATVEAAQKAVQELNGEELLGRPLRLDFAAERGAYTPRSGQDENSYQKGSKSQGGKTIFVRGFNSSVDEHEIRDALKEHFSSCGEITRISIPKGDDGLKGFAYIDFNSDGIDKALEFHQSEVNGYAITVEEAKPKGDFSSGDRGNSSGGRFGRNSSGGRFGRGDRGGRFGRGDRGGRFGRGDRGGRFGRGDRGGRSHGTPNRQSMSTVGTGKKTTFDD